MRARGLTPFFVRSLHFKRVTKYADNLANHKASEGSFIFSGFKNESMFKKIKKYTPTQNTSRNDMVRKRHYINYFWHYTPIQAT